jgi:hypothetical protein
MNTYGPILRRCTFLDARNDGRPGRRVSGAEAHARDGTLTARTNRSGMVALSCRERWPHSRTFSYPKDRERNRHLNGHPRRSKSTSDRMRSIVFETAIGEYKAERKTNTFLCPPLSVFSTALDLIHHNVVIKGSLSFGSRETKQVNCPALS